MGNEMSTSIAAIQARIETDAQALALPAIKPQALQDEAGASASFSFADSFKQMIQSVDAKDRAAADKMAAVDSGRSDDLVGAMLASQEASLSFSMLMQARNKVVGAMEDLIKLQL